MPGQETEEAGGLGSKAATNFRRARARGTFAGAYGAAASTAWMVASTASCAPFHSERPLAKTSTRRASAMGSSTFISASRTLWQIRPPASRNTRATARSSGNAQGARTAEVAHADRWSPKASNWPWQLQARGASCSGSRRRRRSSTRNWAGAMKSSAEAGLTVRARPACGPAWEHHALPVLGERAPALAEACVRQLEAEVVDAACLRSAAVARNLLEKLKAGRSARAGEPSWMARAHQAVTDRGLGDWPHGWQRRELATYTSANARCFQPCHRAPARSCVLKLGRTRAPG